MTSIGDAVIATDTRSNVTFMNVIAEALTGWKLKDAKGKPIHKIFNIINQFSGRCVDNPVARVLKTGMIIGLANHTLLIRKDGSKVPIDDSGAPIKNYKGDIVGVVLVFRDISERKKIEDLVHVKSKEQETILDSTPAMIFYKDKQNRFLRVNKVFCDIMGFSKESLEGRSLFDIYPREQAQAFWRDDLEVMRSGKTKRGIIEPVQTAQGLRICQTDKIPYVNEQGDITGIIGFAIDITERQKAQRLLVEANARLEMAQKAAAAGVWYRDLRSGKLEWSEELFRLFGLDPRKEKADFGLWKTALHPDDRLLVEQSIEEAIKNHTPLAVEYRVVLPAGEVRWINALGNALYDSSGQPQSMSGICIDITERKHIQEALKESEDRYKELVEGSNSIIMKVGKDLNITYMNDFGLKFFGYKNEEVLGRSVLGTTIPQKGSKGEDLASMAEAIVNSPENFRSNVHQNMRKNGELVWVSWTNRVKYDPEGKVSEILAIGNDISKLKEAEDVLRRDKDTFEGLVQERTKELIEAQLELERAKRLSDIGTLAATVAHELRNPLAAIGMAAHNIKRKANNPDLDRHLDNIDRKVMESDQIINNLLFYSRLKPPHYENFHIADILEESIESMGSERRKGIAIIEDLGPLQGIFVDADPYQLREVFINILNNACDAVSPNSGEIKVEAALEGKNIKLTFQDNGEGIDEGSLAKVFDPFFTTKAKGTGLGLSVCQQIINFHEGSICIESHLGQGTTVAVCIPQQRINR